jgi:predicted PurR-regulated permease PerM
MNEELRQSIVKSTSFKVAFTIVLLVFLWLVKDVVALLFLAIIVATAVSPIAGWFEKKGIPRALSVLFIYLFGVLIIGFAIYLLLPPLAIELGALASQLPTYYGNLAQFFANVQETTSGMGAAQSLQQFLGDTADNLANITSGFFSSLLSVVGGLFAVIIIVALSFYLAITGDGVKKFLAAIAPKAYEEYVVQLWGRVEKKIGRWIRGQLLLGFIIGVITYIGLKLFGIPYALVLAVFAGILELLPFAGPIIAAVPAVILGFLQSPTLGIIMILFYALVQQLENNLIVPQVMRRAVGMHPVMVIVALLAGVKLGGLIGVLIAIPIAVVLIEFFEDLAGKKTPSA